MYKRQISFVLFLIISVAAESVFASAGHTLGLGTVDASADDPFGPAVRDCFEKRGFDYNPGEAVAFSILCPNEPLAAFMSTLPRQPSASATPAPTGPGENDKQASSKE